MTNISVPPASYASSDSQKPLRIGPLLISPPVLQAPMAGFTDHAYRQITGRLGGVGLPATEMLSARGFLGGEAQRPLAPRATLGCP